MSYSIVWPGDVDRAIAELLDLQRPSQARRMNTTYPAAGPLCAYRIGRGPVRSARNGAIPMSIEKNIQTVKDFLAAIGRGDRAAMLALAAEDIVWIIPGKDWPLAGTRHGHAGLADLLETASKSIETSTEPREFVAQGDRVLVAGFARGKIIATKKTFEDDWVFAITVRDGRLTSIREYIDTQALARAAQMDASAPS